MSEPLRMRFRVEFVDTDASGRIHFTAAFRWAEAAENGLMRQLGYAAKGEYPRRHVEATYHRALVFNDEFDVHLHIESVGRTSITYAWRMLREDELCIEGRHVAVRVGADGRPIALPDELRAHADRPATAS